MKADHGLKKALLNSIEEIEGKDYKDDDDDGKTRDSRQMEFRDSVQPSMYLPRLSSVPNENVEEESSEKIAKIIKEQSKKKNLHMPLKDKLILGPLDKYKYYSKDALSIYQQSF